MHKYINILIITQKNRGRDRTVKNLSELFASTRTASWTTSTWTPPPQKSLSGMGTRPRVALLGCVSHRMRICSCPPPGPSEVFFFFHRMKEIVPYLIFNLLVFLVFSFSFSLVDSYCVYQRCQKWAFSMHKEQFFLLFGK